MARRRFGGIKEANCTRSPGIARSNDAGIEAGRQQAVRSDRHGQERIVPILTLAEIMAPRNLASTEIERGKIPVVPRPLEQFMDVYEAAPRRKLGAGSGPDFVI